MEEYSCTRKTSIIQKENKDTPETIVENFFELLKNGNKPKKYAKEIGNSFRRGWRKIGKMY